MVTMPVASTAGLQRGFIQTVHPFGANTGVPAKSARSWAVHDMQLLCCLLCLLVLLLLQGPRHAVWCRGTPRQVIPVIEKRIGHILISLIILPICRTNEFNFFDWLESVIIAYAPSATAALGFHASATQCKRSPHAPAYSCHHLQQIVQGGRGRRVRSMLVFFVLISGNEMREV
jgi:hypothetical protein